MNETLTVRQIQQVRQIKLDGEILAAIDAGVVTFSAIFQRVRPVLKEFPGIEYRQLDRRLQSLRKRGAIAFRRSPGLKDRWQRTDREDRIARAVLGT